MSSKQKGNIPAGALKAAVDKTFQATVGGAQVTRGRAQEIVDDVSQAAGKVRSVLEDLRLATGEDVKSLRDEISELKSRVKKLEQAQSSKQKASGKKVSKPK